MFRFLLSTSLQNHRRQKNPNSARRMVLDMPGTRSLLRSAGLH